MKPTNKIALSTVKDLFVVDTSSRTGISWKKNNRPAGTILPSGYCQVRIPGGNLFVYTHRIVWMLHNDKEIPEGDYQVDHIDRCRSNNRPENLQLILQYWNLIRRDTSKADGLPSNVLRTQDGFRACFRFNGQRYSEKFDTVVKATNWLHTKRTELCGEPSI